MSLYSAYTYEPTFWNRAGDWLTTGVGATLLNTYSTTVNSTVGLVSSVTGISETAEIVKNETIMSGDMYQFYQDNRAAVDVLSFGLTLPVTALGVSRAANYIGKSTAFVKHASAGSTASLGPALTKEISGVTYASKLNALFAAKEQLAAGTVSVGKQFEAARRSYFIADGINYAAQGVAQSYLLGVLNNQNQTLYAGKDAISYLVTDPIFDGGLGFGLGSVIGRFGFGSLTKKYGFGEDAIAKRAQDIRGSLGSDVSATYSPGTQAAAEIAKLAEATAADPKRFSDALTAQVSKSVLSMFPKDGPVSPNTILSAIGAGVDSPLDVAAKAGQLLAGVRSVQFLNPLTSSLKNLSEQTVAEYFSINKATGAVSKLVDESSFKEATKQARLSPENYRVYATSSETASLVDSSSTPAVTLTSKGVDIYTESFSNSAFAQQVLDLDTGGIIRSGNLTPYLGDFKAANLAIGESISVPKDTLGFGTTAVGEYAVWTNKGLSFNSALAQKDLFAVQNAWLNPVGGKALPAVYSPVENLPLTYRAINQLSDSGSIKIAFPGQVARAYTKLDAAKELEIYQVGLYNSTAKTLGSDFAEIVSGMRPNLDGVLERYIPRFEKSRYAILVSDPNEIYAFSKRSPQVQNYLNEAREISKSESLDAIARHLPEFYDELKDTAELLTRAPQTRIDTSPSLLAIRTPNVGTLEAQHASLGLWLQKQGQKITTSVVDAFKPLQAISKSRPEFSAELTQLSLEADRVSGLPLYLTRTVNEAKEVSFARVSSEYLRAEKAYLNAKTPRIAQNALEVLERLKASSSHYQPTKEVGQEVFDLLKRQEMAGRSDNALRDALGKRAGFVADDYGSETALLHFPKVKLDTTNNYTLFAKTKLSSIDGSYKTVRLDFKTAQELETAKARILEVAGNDVSDVIAFAPNTKQIGKSETGWLAKFSDIKTYKLFQNEYEITRDISHVALDSAIQQKGVQQSLLGNDAGDLALIRLGQGVIEFENRRLRNGLELAAFEHISELKAYDRLWHSEQFAGKGATEARLQGTKEINLSQNNLANLEFPPVSPAESSLRTIFNDVSREPQSVAGALGVLGSRGVEQAWEVLHRNVYSHVRDIFMSGKDLARATKARQALDNISKYWEIPPGDGKLLEDVAKVRYGSEPNLAKAVQNFNMLTNALTLRMDFWNPLANAMSLPSTTSSWVIGLVNSVERSGKVIPDEARELLSLGIPGSSYKLGTTAKLLHEAVGAAAKQSGDLHDLVIANMPNPKLSQSIAAGVQDIVATSNILVGEGNVAKFIEKVESQKILGAFPKFNDWMEFNINYISGHMAAKVGKSLGLTDAEIVPWIKQAQSSLNANTLTSAKHPFWHTTIGQAVGLFQSYTLNMIGRTLQSADDGLPKGAMTLAALNTAVGGLRGLPWVETLNNWYAGKNPSHQDLFSTVNSVVGKEMGDWIQYGPVSNLLGVNLYGRANLTPGGIFNLDVPPTVRQTTDAIVESLKFVQNNSNGAGGVNSLLQALEHQSYNRPISGIATLLQGRRTTKEGKQITTTEETAQNTAFLDDDLAYTWGSIVRVLGGRPLNEAIYTDTVYKYTSFKKRDQAELSKLARALTLRDDVRGAIDKDAITEYAESPQLAESKARYAALGGNPKEWQAFLTRQYLKSTSNPGEDVAKKFYNPQVIANISIALGADSRVSNLQQLLEDRQDVK